MHWKNAQRSLRSSNANATSRATLIDACSRPRRTSFWDAAVTRLDTDRVKDEVPAVEHKYTKSDASSCVQRRLCSVTGVCSADISALTQPGRQDISQDSLTRTRLLHSVTQGRPSRNTAAGTWLPPHLQIFKACSLIQSKRQARPFNTETYLTALQPSATLLQHCRLALIHCITATVHTCKG